MSAATPDRKSHRPLSKRTVAFSRPVDPRELKRSPNRTRLMARAMLWAVAFGGAAVILPHVMM